MRRDLLRTGKYSFTLLLLLTFLLTLFRGTESLLAADNSFGSHPSATEIRYNKAKDFYYQLRRDKSIQDNRQNWAKGVSDFRQIYLEDPKGELAPNCLFMLATMHYRMYLHFQIRADLDEAITYYLNVWLFFPDNTLADDAMYWAAEIHQKHNNNPGQAAQLYAEQIRRYPDGDKYAQALNRLREIDDTHELAAREKLALPATDTDLIQVLPVQYWSSDNYTRIVIRASGPVTYTSKLPEGNSKQPRKLLIDFAHSTIDKKYQTPVAIKDNLLQQIRSEQLNPDTVRINLDIESISTYKIFSLNDPFRVIVDVHGQQKVLSVSKTVPQLERERVEPPKEKVLPQTAAKKVPGREKVESRDLESGVVDPLEPFIILQENNKRNPEEARFAKEVTGRQNGLSLAQQLGLGVRRIVIDPGHGGKDPGAMGNGLKEKDITLRVARKTAEQLRSAYDYEVILTRDNDRSLPLEERTAIANTKKADLFISIHVNAHPDKSTRGVETFYLNLATNTEAMRVAALENATTTMNISDLQDILTGLMQNSKIRESSVLAEYIQNKMVSGLRESNYSTTDLGVKQAPFYVLIGAQMPAVLAEISFISNHHDAKRLQEEKFLEAIARQIAAGITGYIEHQATAALRM
jgi:N-acetylmuramoyl-L-alanine amidase